MKSSFVRHSADRALTLIELLVVLAILAALAGIVTASMPGLLRQSSAAACGAGALQLTQVMQSYCKQYAKFPDGYDSLLEGPYQLLQALPPGTLRQLKPKDLDNADRPLLWAAGIRSTWRHDSLPQPVGVTFRTVSTNKAFDATLGGFAADDVAALDTQRIDVDALFGPGTRKGGTNEIFAVFGVGRKCTLVGAAGGILEAPITFGATASTDPDLVYQRYGVVFRFDRDEHRPVRFLGAVIFDHDGIKTPGKKAGEWFLR